MSGDPPVCEYSLLPVLWLSCFPAQSSCLILVLQLPYKQSLCQLDPQAMPGYKD